MNNGFLRAGSSTCVLVVSQTGRQAGSSLVFEYSIDVKSRVRLGKHYFLGYLELWSVARKAN